VSGEERRPGVLLIEDDAAIAELVRSVLVDEGFAVSVLPGVRSDALRAAINRLEPDCILLDGESSMAGYGTSWTDAALGAPARPADPGRDVHRLRGRRP
jgi:CheY-like chemotaxis protein